MAKANRFIIQPSSTVISEGTTNLVMDRTKVEVRSNGLLSQAAILYAKTTAENGDATLNIQVFNQVLGTEFSLGSFTAITTETVERLIIGSNITGYGVAVERPLIAPFVVRQVLTGTGSPAFNVELELQWLSSGQLIS